MSYYDDALRMRPLVEKAVQSLTDTEALQAKTLYPAWSAGVYYEEGYRVTYGGELYRVRQDHTSQADWPPGTDTAALYSRIDETHAGTIDDPIPYSGNMALEYGQYYSQDGITYLCIRNTEIPVYNALWELVGIYVEVAE